MKTLQNITLGTVKQVLTAIHGILIVKLVEIDTKIKVLSLKMQRLLPKILILTSVYVIAPEDPLGINFFKIFLFLLMLFFLQNEHFKHK